MLARSPRNLAILSFAVFFFMLAVYHEAPWTPSLPGEQILSGWQQHAGLFGHNTNTSGGSENSSSSRPSSNSWTSFLKPHFEPDPAPEPEQHLLPWQMDKGGNRSLIDGVKEDAEQVEDWDEYMKSMLDWDRPQRADHWPPYGEYVGKEYDPNRWEGFERDERIFHASHDKLDPDSATSPKYYRPYPKYNSQAWRKKWKGRYIACDGPRGVPLDDENTEDIVQVYKGVPSGSPRVFAGGYDALGLDGDVCFDRYSRYGPYGLGDGEPPSPWNSPRTMVNWTDVNWGELQDACLERNKLRYHPSARAPAEKNPSIMSPPFSDPSTSLRDSSTENSTYTANHKAAKQYHPRTALLIRAWTGYRFRENDIMSIRSLISELSLQSGAEYTVYLFLHVKDASLFPSFLTNATVRQSLLDKYVPPELHSITLLWSEGLFPAWYPKVEDWQVYWHQYMCLQWFSLAHPQFDYIWNWETDARYTGQHYHLLEKLGRFADAQPRKYLWERNKRFYIPSIHGPYEEFVNGTHETILRSSEDGRGSDAVWGPRPFAGAEPKQEPLGPSPPWPVHHDNFTWGTSTSADLITLLPIWDPRNTSWSYRHKIWNFVPGVAPHFTPAHPTDDGFDHPAFEGLERRVFINTVVRLSKKLLLAMHRENLEGRAMQAEMWPASVALQHGFKAVYAPHPVFVDRRWPTGYAGAVFDSSSEASFSIEDGEASSSSSSSSSRQRNDGAEWTEGPDSPYNRDREWNFAGWSWYYASRFPRRIYRAWLGWEVEGDGLPLGREGEAFLENGEGEKSLCLPGMLLHPVKDVRREKVR